MNITVIDDFFKSINFDIGLLAEFENIYVLVSGGIDSTVLAVYIKHHYPEKTWFVNCYNPLERNKTLTELSKADLYLVTRPESIDLSAILRESFLQLNKAAQDRFDGGYSKSTFLCCRKIKERAFKEDPLFSAPGSVVISGIKAGDNNRRRFFCKNIREGKNTGHYSNPVEAGFFYRHKEGILYCYPYRDYLHKELPREVLREVRKRFPEMAHTGCKICPIRLLFSDRGNNEPDQLNRSLKYARKLIREGALIPSKILLKYIPPLDPSQTKLF
jgi:hypothetical protein